jgi:hypothetical protein
MLLKMRKYKNFDFINNITPSMQKAKTTTKIQAVIDGIKPKTEVVKQSFTKPNTSEEWEQFHQMNERGIKKAYDSSEGYFKQDNKLFIAGTRDLHDVYDWAKIPLNDFENSKIYKNADAIFKNDSSIDYVVGHSAGGSAALELEKQHPNRKITSITYSSPVFSRFNYEQFKHEEKQPLRFYHPGDVVASMDMNARPVWKAPEFNLDLMNDVGAMYSKPSVENVLNISNSITNSKNFDPLTLHTMDNSYSKPSKPMDFVKSAVEGTTLATGAGIL